MMDSDSGFLQCYLIDGRGGGRSLESTGVGDWSPDQGVLWVHLDVGNPASHRWLRDASGVEDFVCDALLAEETRPRSLSNNEGLLVVLRGVNTNPGEDPEDMVSLRVWIEKDRILSTQRRRLLSVLDVRDAIVAGRGPATTGAFIATIVETLADRIGAFVDSIEERTSTAEDEFAQIDPADFRRVLAALRREIALVRRFLAPQRDALDRLTRLPGPWLSEDDAMQLRTEADRITRYMEDLDLARERAVVLQEELLSQLAQEQNSRMYLLSVVAALFLPLTFVTGLLGMNVGGLPGTDSTWGFWGSVVMMLLAGGALFALFRWRKWI